MVSPYSFRLWPTGRRIIFSQQTSTGAVHKSVTLRYVFILVQLNKCVVCGSVLQMEHSGDGCLCSSILFKYECRVGHLFVLSWATVRQCALGNVVSELSTWSGVCNFVAFPVVEICAEYGGMYVSHVCFTLCVVYGVGIGVDVCGVICVVECYLFFFVLLRVICGFRCVDVCAGVFCAPSCNS